MKNIDEYGEWEIFPANENGVVVSVLMKPSKKWFKMWYDSAVIDGNIKLKEDLERLI